MLKTAAVTRVIVAYDHPVVMLGVKVLLRERDAGLEVLGEASTGVELMAQLAKQQCDLLITDFSIPCGLGREAGLLLLAHLKKTHPLLPIIVLTMDNNPLLVRAMLDLGVNAVVGRVNMVADLILATVAVDEGRTYVSDGLLVVSDEKTSRTFLDGRFVPSIQTAPSVLSKREAEIVRLYAEGFSITQISEQVHRSVKTISQQKNDAMRKLGLTSNSQLYEYVRLSRLA